MSKARQPPPASTSRTALLAPPSAPPSVDLLTLVGREYANLRNQSHCPLGMYIVPSVASLLLWDGVFFVHKGYYASSVLRFKINLENYPERAPIVNFVTDTFHPLISQSDGRLSLSPRFPTWLPTEHRIFEVLHWIKAAFKKRALDGLEERDCLNKEAFRYRDSTQSFAALAAQTSALSQSPSALYDRDHPSIGGVKTRGGGGVVFKEMGKDELAKLRSKIGLEEWAEKTV